jgi:hypothetical protein
VLAEATIWSSPSIIESLIWLILRLGKRSNTTASLNFPALDAVCWERDSMGIVAGV